MLTCCQDNSELYKTEEDACGLQDTHTSDTLLPFVLFFCFVGLKEFLQMALEAVGLIRNSDHFSNHEEKKFS